MGGPDYSGSLTTIPRICGSQLVVRIPPSVREGIFRDNVPQPGSTKTKAVKESITLSSFVGNPRVLRRFGKVLIVF